MARAKSERTTIEITELKMNRIRVRAACDVTCDALLCY
jgi:hypothetical protein